MKFIFSLLVAVIVGSLSCSAADLDSVDYYSLSPVQSLSPTVNSALDYAVQPLAATSWDTSDQTNLSWIRNAFYYPNSGYISNSLLGWVQKLADNSVSLTGLVSDVSDLSSGLVGTSNSVLWYAREIYNDTSELHNIYLSTSNISRMSEEIYNALEGDYNSIKETNLAIWDETETISSFISSIYTDLINLSYVLERSFSFNMRSYDANGNVISEFTPSGTYPNFNVLSGISLSFDGKLYNSTGEFTVLHYIKQLSNVLASDDDLLLAESQKANREEIEDSFLTGSSGSTSLGVSDFGDLADIGGTIKDSLSLDGNATIGSFTSGLAAADSAGQGWFSEENRSQLDAVSSTVTYSLRDPDPYNMAGWEDRYYWLLGDGE